MGAGLSRPPAPNSKRFNVTTRSVTFGLTTNYRVIMGEKALNSKIVKYPLVQMSLQLENTSVNPTLMDYQFSGGKEIGQPEIQSTNSGGQCLANSNESTSIRNPIRKYFNSSQVELNSNQVK